MIGAAKRFAAGVRSAWQAVQPGRQLSLFDSPLPADRPPTFPELCRGIHAQVEVEVGNRLMDSWRVFWNRKDGKLRLKVPQSLWDAPLEIKEAVLEWALLVSRRGRRRDPARRVRRAGLEALIKAYLQADPPGRRDSRLARNRRKLQRLNPRGRCHDLEDAFRRVNETYFQSALLARLTWSSRLGGLSTHTVAQDGEGRPYHLISISRGYDNSDVTPEILDGVVYHECLHIAIPPREEGGRRVVHGPDFRRREKEYLISRHGADGTGRAC